MLCENTVVCVNSFFHSFLKIICNLEDIIEIMIQKILTQNAREPENVL